MCFQCEVSFFQGKGWKIGVSTKISTNHGGHPIHDGYPRSSFWRSFYHLPLSSYFLGKSWFFLERQIALKLKKVPWLPLQHQNCPTKLLSAAKGHLVRASEQVWLKASQGKIEPCLDWLEHVMCLIKQPFFRGPVLCKPCLFVLIACGAHL